MYDFDPRWPDDPRDDEYDRDLSRGSRGASDDRDQGRSLDPRDVFMNDLDLARGPEREHVRERSHDDRLRGSESRTLATVGAFRVVPAGDLRDGQDRPLDPRNGDLYHLRKSGLVQTIPSRTPEEIYRWALEHNLPEEDGHVQFPDARIEYEDRDGRLRTEDLEVETLHYRGGHATAKASSGFPRYSGSTMRVVGSRGGGGGGGGRGRHYGLGITASTGKSGGRSPDPRIAEELLR